MHKNSRLIAPGFSAPAPKFSHWRCAAFFDPARMETLVIVFVCFFHILRTWHGSRVYQGNGSFSPRALEAIDSRGNDKVDLGIINGQAISVPARDGVPCITFFAEFSRQLRKTRLA